jgi:peptidylprolyl isomerase
MKPVFLVLLLCLTLAAGGCGGQTVVSTKPVATSNASHLVEEILGRTRPQIDAPSRPPPRKPVAKDLVVGSGAGVKFGDLLTVEYFGIRYTGEEFSSSWDNGGPFEFRLGSNDPAVSPGWEKGLVGMKVGGRRELILPPELLYHGGGPPNLRPDEAVIYEIDLLEAE